MTRDQYDVAAPHPSDTADDPPPGPICPHCGGGPPVATDWPTRTGHIRVLICKSCARIVARA